MTVIVLSCGHAALPQERLRAGSERWCPVCCCWLADEGAELLDLTMLVEEAASFLRHPVSSGLVDAPLAVDGEVGRCVSCGGWTGLAGGAWCRRCDETTL